VPPGYRPTSIADCSRWRAVPESAFSNILYRMTTLHVTNGDSVAGTLNEIVSSDEAVLPWRDVLHDGPVPGGLDANALRETRAKFLAERGWASYDMVLADITGRDAALAAMGASDHVMLWFEPDLYDQLQLLQILAQLYVRPRAERPTISIVAADELLGPLSAAQLAKYITLQRVVREVDLELAALGWEAFTSGDVTLLKAFAATETALFEAQSYQSDSSVVLPHMHSAIRRWLQEFPSPENGLSRTEQQTVNVLLSGAKTLGALYQAAHGPSEDFVWLGDWGFAWYVDRLMAGPVALVEFVATEGGADAIANPNATTARPGFSAQRSTGDAAFWKQQVQLTDAGRTVAKNRANAVSLNGIDRWFGGVHLKRAALSANAGAGAPTTPLDAPTTPLDAPTTPLDAPTAPLDAPT